MTGAANQIPRPATIVGLAVPKITPVLDGPASIVSSLSLRRVTRRRAGGGTSNKTTKCNGYRSQTDMEERVKVTLKSLDAVDAADWGMLVLRLAEALVRECDITLAQAQPVNDPAHLTDKRFVAALKAVVEDAAAEINRAVAVGNPTSYGVALQAKCAVLSAARAYLAAAGTLEV